MKIHFFVKLLNSLYEDATRKERIVLI